MTHAASRYSPLYFLASLGAGGIAVTFFMWLMFWVPHPGQPVPVLADSLPLVTGGGIAQQAMILTAWVGIAVFATLNIKLLVWNLRRFAEFRRAPGYAGFLASNAGSQVLALPLALAMSVNVGFILGLTFVPGLWGVVEYLFPLAIAAFLAIGALALKQLAQFFGARLAGGGLSCAANNSLAQILPGFALAMIGVGLAAPAAMSTNPVTAGISITAATFFTTAALVIAAIALVLGTRAMLEHGVNPEAAPTIMVVIPLMTVLGIALMRIDHGMHAHFGSPAGAGETLIFLTRLLSVEVLFALAGLAVLARIGYAARFLGGAERSAGSYALVCPGIAMSVLIQFWLNKGLVAAGLVAAFGPAYWAISALAVALQLAMIALVWQLGRAHFARDAGAALPA